MSADALAPCNTKPSAVIVLIVKNQQILDFHEERLLLSLSFQRWKIIKYKTVIVFPKINSSQQGSNLAFILIEFI